MPDQQTPPSPLAEADPKSLDELFNADPLELTNKDLAALVTELRANRDKWAKEEAESQTKARPRRPSKYKAVPPKGSLSLENLGLTNVTLPKGKKDDE
jgi:hypothetical protein